VQWFVLCTLHNKVAFGLTNIKIKPKQHYVTYGTHQTWLSKVLFQIKGSSIPLSISHSHTGSIFAGAIIITKVKLMTDSR